MSFDRTVGFSTSGHVFVPPSDEKIESEVAEGTAIYSISLRKWGEERETRRGNNSVEHVLPSGRHQVTSFNKFPPFPRL